MTTPSVRPLLALLLAALCPLAAAKKPAEKPPFPDPAQATVVGILNMRYRWVLQLPGPDGTLGRVADTLVGEGNPYGRDPDDPAGRDDRIVDATELVLPADKPIILHLESIDYLHTFSVKAYAIDELVIPGKTSRTWFQPRAVGKHAVLCTQYCGKEHDDMKATLRLVTREEFEAWVAAHSTKPD